MHRLTRHGQTGVARDRQDRRGRYAKHPSPAQKPVEARLGSGAEAIGEVYGFSGRLPIIGESPSDFG
jgi:hypothetical protein